MLKFHGHVFTDSARCSCCVGDKQVAVLDPTATGKLRAKFRMSMGHKWNTLRELLKMMINKQDLLSLKSGGLMNVNAPGITHAGSKIDIFQRWFDLALDNAVLQKDGSWMRPFLNEAYSIGTSFGQRQANTIKTHILAGHRSEALQALARVELQGVMEAVSQQSIRVVANGLLTNMAPMAITRQVLNVIETVGRNRSNAMIELLVIRAHAEASLDIYEAAGIATVGLIPESRAQAKVVTDAQTQPKAKTKTKDAKRSGPGSRSRAATPSKSTINRIRRAELNTAKRLGENVNVRTAGDDDVCPVCEAISEDGPYSINTARGLIPAHPHCRCSFIPADDARFAQDTLARGELYVNGYALGQASSGSSLSDAGGNPNRDPETGQFTTSQGSEHGTPITINGKEKKSTHLIVTKGETRVGEVKSTQGNAQTSVHQGARYASGRGEVERFRASGPNRPTTYHKSSKEAVAYLQKFHKDPST